MEELTAKLVNVGEQIRLINDSSNVSDITKQYETCCDILRCLIDEVRQSRKREWCNQQLRVQQHLEKITQALMKTLRVQKRQRVRNVQSDNNSGSCCAGVSDEKLIELSQDLITELQLKSFVDQNNDIKVDDLNSSDDVSNTGGLPSSVQEYKYRLEKYNKELYKNPPVMPPSPVTVIDNWNNNLPPIPQRDPKTQRLTFYMPYEAYETSNMKSNSESIVVTDFHPNVTPEEVLLGGAFGGTYFRNIHSAVTNVHFIGMDVIKDTLAPEWISKFDSKSIRAKLTSSTYHTSINKFKAKCGGSLGMWEVREI
jgi:hypothetical protein